MPHSDRERLQAIKTFPSLVRYLRDDLDWPIVSADNFDDLSFDWEAEELGIDLKTSAKIEYIKQLRPLQDDQPWGIFFAKFEPKRLPVVALRRILGALALKKRASAARSERPAWRKNDLLFISAYGEDDRRHITFAHFADNPETGDLPVLRVLGWDGSDTALHIDHVHETLTSKLCWPGDEEDTDTWRETWSGAFTLQHREVITTSKQMAIRLADLARETRNKINSILAVEKNTGPMHKLMAAFKEALIHDLDEDGFADTYAQTIAYGLLSARISRPAGLTADNLADMVPITNPFLKELMETFLHLGGRRDMLDFDELGINDVVDVLRNANMEAVLRDFGDRNPQEDPVIHFFEGFLREYDPKKRMRRGVFYTPQPVVAFIVRSVHELLQTEFGLVDGLADTTTWREMAERMDGLEIPEGTDPDSPFVVILDPATGTATFLVEVIDVIRKTMVAKWHKAGKADLYDIPRLWNEYVPKHLLPRLHGYELMMAPYAIAHMKIGLKLFETGYHFGSDERARVYLTNALEPAKDFTGTLAFAIPALAHEAEAVNAIKRDQQFTVVIGNPPYDYQSQNTGDFVSKLVSTYYYVDGEKLMERNPRGLQDDYVKFIRLAQHTVASAQWGLLAMITNHSFIDNVTFRGMRRSLQASSSLISVVDLHGNANKGEVSPDGSRDKPVFQIKQGVAIMFACATTTSSAHCRVSHADLWGEADSKLGFLATHSYSSVQWTDVMPFPPNYLLGIHDGRTMHEYMSFVDVRSLFPIYSGGLNSLRDGLVVSQDKQELVAMVKDFCDRAISDSSFSEKYSVSPDTRDWCLAERRSVAQRKGRDYYRDTIRQCLYRPYDIRWIVLHEDFVAYPRWETTRHFMDDQSLGFATSRQAKKGFAVLASRLPFGQHKIVDPYDRSFVFPVETARLHDELDLGSGEGGASEIFGYAYAVMHSPDYRNRYAELLKVDFPRIPLSGSPGLFRDLACLGGVLAALHLMESPKLDKYITTVTGSGEFRVEKVSYSDETVWTNKAKTCGFKGVPEDVWNFHIGGYQVCEKWLKDRQARGGKNPRRGRILMSEDIDHYQKIVVALNETIRIMAEIDEVIEAHGGWPDAFITDPKILEGLKPKKA